MKQHKKFSSDQQQEQLAQHLTAQNSAQEFSTVEELLRYDAARTAAPPGVEERLRKSSADFPKPARSWWQRLFSK